MPRQRPQTRRRVGKERVPRQAAVPLAHKTRRGKWSIRAHACFYVSFVHASMCVCMCVCVRVCVCVRMSVC